MKKTLKRIALGLGILIVFLVIFFVGYGIKAKSEIKSMTPLETKQIVENVFSIQDTFVNLFLIKDGDQYVAIDAGNNPEIVSEELKKLNISPEKVVAVLLTHTDGDHVAAITLFKNAKIYLSKQEEQLINGEEGRFFIFGNKVDTKDYILIEDQDNFNIGNLNIKGILTPGHTLGSMCYLINEKYLFIGDAASLKAGKLDKFNTFFNMDTNTALESMSIISNIPEAEYLITDHYGYTDDYKNAVKDWGK